MKYYGKNHLIALGDSHLEALKLAADLNILNIESSSFFIVPGATAVGLRNPNSVTDALGIFSSALASQSADSRVIIHLGEVDCGFVMWWRAKKYGESVEVQFKESISAYGDFLSDVVGRGFKDLCLTGASLPTIRDCVDMSEVANKRSDIVVGIYERTLLTLRYNKELESLAFKYGIDYFDISNAVLNQRTGVVHDFFRNQDPRDHHLDKNKVAGVWAERCNAFLAGCL